MRVQTFAVALLVASTAPLMGQSSVSGAPETFIVNAQAKGWRRHRRRRAFRDSRHELYV